MSAFAVEPVIIDVDMAVVHAVLERARVALSVDDHTCLESLVRTFADLTRLVRERGTTIARLRRLFGLKLSEKTADVFGDATTPTADATTPTADATTPTADATSATDGDASVRALSHSDRDLRTARPSSETCQ